MAFAGISLSRSGVVGARANSLAGRAFDGVAASVSGFADCSKGGQVPRAVNCSIDA